MFGDCTANRMLSCMFHTTAAFVSRMSTLRFSDKAAVYLRSFKSPQTIQDGKIVKVKNMFKQYTLSVNRLEKPLTFNNSMVLVRTAQVRTYLPEQQLLSLSCYSMCRSERWQTTLCERYHRGTHRCKHGKIEPHTIINCQ